MINVELMLPQSALVARDQGRRPTCLAFALCEVEHCNAPAESILSAEYLYLSAASKSTRWRPNGGLELQPALQAARSVAIEPDCPYQPAEPTQPLPKLPAHIPLFGTPASEVPMMVGQIVQRLRHGQVAGLGLMLTEAFFRPNGDRITDGASVQPHSAHAVAAVGLGWEGTTPLFWVRNSWGAAWGRNGSAWLSGDYVQRHAIFAFGL